MAELDAAKTQVGWTVTPDAIKWTAKLLYERYNVPIYVSENGMACHDTVSLDGKVHDPNRVDYLNRYLLKLGEAIDEGADVRGYFVWSFMDNFEGRRAMTHASELYMWITKHRSVLLRTAVTGMQK